MKEILMILYELVRMDVKVDFAYVKIWSMIMHVDYIYEFLMGLLSIVEEWESMSTLHK